MRRSHAEDEGQVMPKGSIGRTTPAVSASERRKSLKLVGGKKNKKMCAERTSFCFSDLLQASTDVKFLQTFISSFYKSSAQFSLFPSGLSSRLGTLCPVPVSPSQHFRAGCPQDSRQTLEQQLHRGGKSSVIITSVHFCAQPIYSSPVSHKQDKSEK